MTFATAVQYQDPVPAGIKNLGLCEYLDGDSRPSFVVPLTSSGLQHGLTPEYANKAFQSLASQNSTLNISDLLLHNPSDPETVEFVRWVQNGSEHPYFRYQNYLWTAVTLRKQWRVISCDNVTEISGASCQRKEPDYASSYSSMTSTDTSGNVQPHERSNFSKTVYSCDPAWIEHHKFVSDFDWASTPLGPISTWPENLFETVSYCLFNPGPCCVLWGSDRIMIYNQPYVLVAQEFHPKIMGVSAFVAFPTFWSDFDKTIKEVEQTKQSVRHEGVSVVLVGAGGHQERIFDYSFMPCFNAAGEVCGVFNHCSDYTRQNIAERQLATLIRIGEHSSSAINLKDLWRAISVSAQDGAPDLPFAAMYTVDEEDLLAQPLDLHKSKLHKTRWNFIGAVGMKSTVAIADPQELASVLRNLPADGSPLLVKRDDAILSDSVFTDCTHRGVDVPSVTQLLVRPLRLPSGGMIALLVLGLNPLRPYDEDYKCFINLLSRQVENAATSVILFEKERRRFQDSLAEAELEQNWLSGQLELQKQEVDASNLRFYNFADQAPVGVHVINPEGQVMYGNDAWYKLLGLPTGKQGNAIWRDRIHPDDLQAADEQWQMLTQGFAPAPFEWRAVRNPDSKSGKLDVVHLLSSNYPELTDDGSLKRVTSIVVDISIHKAHERTVVDQLNNVLEAKRAQENFMDMVSHEMRNPLNAMLQCAEEAVQLFKAMPTSRSEHTEPSSTVAEILESMETLLFCGRHQREIINDVLTISKLDSNLLTLSPAQISPASLINQVLTIFACEIRANNITVSQDTATLADETLYCMDPARVLQILINLVGNAIKFMKDRSMCRLHLLVNTSTSRPAPKGMNFVRSGQQRTSPNAVDWGKGKPVYVYFSVSDTGPGLSEDEMNELFARFKQASPRTHTQYGGSGLGLFISRELAEMHGGEIGLSSQVQKGSTFAFYVKAYTVPEADTSPTIASSPDATSEITNTTRVTLNQRLSAKIKSSPSSATTDVTVLIVEDNLVNQKVLDRGLKRLGFKTTTANHGEEALTQLRNSTWWHDHEENRATTISIVLCDLEMPVMDGMACIKQIRMWQDEGKLTDVVPVIAVSGNARPEQVNSAKKAGFDDVVSKPYSIPDLVSRIDILLGRSQAETRPEQDTK